MNRRSDEAKTSERARAHAALPEEALKRPGIPEIMRVYGDWRTADRGLDPYRTATKVPWRTATADHADPPAGLLTRTARLSGAISLPNRAGRCYRLRTCA